MVAVNFFAQIDGDFQNDGLADYSSYWPGKCQLCQNERNVLGENINLIILSLGEGQEVITKWSCCSMDPDGNADHKSCYVGPRDRTS